MDVFNSALKNPHPPSRKRQDDDRGSPSASRPVSDPSGESMKSSVSPSAVTLKPFAEKPEGQTAKHKRKNSRRRHRNSHLGCGICKKRRIKCDENLPQCLNCVKGKLHCAYLNLDAPARNALRLAQFNQSLRDDRQEEAASKLVKDNTAYSDFPTDPSHAAQFQGQLPKPAEPFYSLAPNPHAAITSNDGKVAMASQIVNPPIATIVASPAYGPVIQLQPPHPAATVPYPVQMGSTPQVQQYIYSRGDSNAAYHASQPPHLGPPVVGDVHPIVYYSSQLPSDGASYVHEAPPPPPHPHAPVNNSLPSATFHGIQPIVNPMLNAPAVQPNVLLNGSSIAVPAAQIPHPAPVNESGSQQRPENGVSKVPAPPSEMTDGSSLPMSASNSIATTSSGSSPTLHRITVPPKQESPSNSTPDKNDGTEVGGTLADQKKTDSICVPHETTDTGNDPDKVSSIKMLLS